MMKKERLDTYLIRLGKFDSRERAKAAILEGKVFVDGKPVNKAGTFVSPSSEVTVKKKDEEFVSRGGTKLKKALDVFKINVNEKVILDVGASTGGFTDCLLKKGAKLVIAVDVGYGQLAWPLRKDPRVFVIERTNIRYLTPDKIPTLAEMVVIDLSFISVKKVIENIKKIVKHDAEYLILIKPQFEAGKELVGKKGIVRDSETHKKVLIDTWKFFEEKGFAVKGLTYSPIAGAKGNIEFFLYLIAGKEKTNQDVLAAEVGKIVSEAHNFLLKTSGGRQ